MPGNIVKINNNDKLEWCIGDSKIDFLVKWLNENESKSGEKVVEDKTISLKEYTKMDSLDQWLSQLIFPGNPKEFFHKLEEHNQPGVEVFRKFCFYTQDHQYIILATDRTEDDGYLGCQVQCRKPRPGEDWLRGNDLPDGKFNKNTWDNIVISIVRYEIAKLSKFIKPTVGVINHAIT